MERFQKIKKVVYEGNQISCYITNSPRGRTLLIESGPYLFGVYEIPVLKLLCEGKTYAEINTALRKGGAHSMIRRLREKNPGVPLSQLYAHATRLELFHPISLIGLMSLLEKK